AWTSMRCPAPPFPRTRWPTASAARSCCSTSWSRRRRRPRAPTRADPKEPDVNRPHSSRYALQLKMSLKIITVVAAGLLARTAAAQQPQIEVAPEQEHPQNPQTALPRETPVETPLGTGPAIVGSAIGGYGELTLNAPLGDSPGNAVVDLRRVVLFVG